MESVTGTGAGVGGGEELFLVDRNALSGHGNFFLGAGVSAASGAERFIPFLPWDGFAGSGAMIADAAREKNLLTKHIFFITDIAVEKKGENAKDLYLFEEFHVDNIDIFSLIYKLSEKMRTRILDTYLFFLIDDYLSFVFNK